MLISNTYNDHNIELIMDNTVLQIVNSHKHLGVVLSSNNKWTNNIDTIIQSASKQISFFRKLKYKFSKNSLNKFIVPLLEYASELWDGCNQTDADRLEKIQLNAARIVTGLPFFSSLSSLYFETGWETLADRRKSKKLNLMYKIINNDSPSYLVDLLPYRVQEIYNYNLRSRENFDVPFSRLCSYETSFIPSTLRLWNELDIDIRRSSTQNEFKSKLRKQITKVNDFL